MNYASLASCAWIPNKSQEIIFDCADTENFCSINASSHYFQPYFTILLDPNRTIRSCVTWDVPGLELHVIGYQMIGDKNLHGARLSKKTHLVHHGHNTLQNLSFERPKNDAVVFNWEGHVSSTIADKSLSNISDMSDRYNEPMTPAAGAFNILDDFGDELVSELRAKVARVKLHLLLQHDVEEHGCSLAELKLWNQNQIKSP